MQFYIIIETDEERWFVANSHHSLPYLSSSLLISCTPSANPDPVPIIPLWLTLKHLRLIQQIKHPGKEILSLSQYRMNLFDIAFRSHPVHHHMNMLNLEIPHQLDSLFSDLHGVNM
jgi:hypothetical protein